MKDCTELASPAAPFSPKPGQIQQLFPPPPQPRHPRGPPPQSAQITRSLASNRMEESNSSGLVMPDLSSLFCVPLGGGGVGNK